MAFLVSYELEAVALGEGRHLGGGDHLLPSARGHDDMSVVDHAVRGSAADVPQRLGQERFALKAGEARIDLEEDHPRVAEHDGSDLHLDDPSADRGPMGGGVVLHLLAGRELVVSGRRLWGRADAVLATEGGECGVRELGAAGEEVLVYPAEVAL